MSRQILFPYSCFYFYLVPWVCDKLILLHGHRDDCRRVLSTLGSRDLLCTFQPATTRSNFGTAELAKGHALKIHGYHQRTFYNLKSEIHEAATYLARLK